MKDRLFWARIDASGRLTGEGSDAVVPWWSLTKPAIAATAFGSPRPAGSTSTPPRPADRRCGRSSATRPGFPTTPGCPRTPRPWRAASRPGLPRRCWRAAPRCRRPGRTYSNIGYLLARRAIEAAAGAPLAALLRTRLLEPLGLAATRLAERPGEMDALALPAPGYDPGWVYHGCLLGPVADAAAMLAGILAGPLLSPGSRRALLDAIPVGGRLSGRPWLEAGYGLGLMTGRMQSRDGPLIAAGHSAGGPGSGGAAYRFPDLPDAPCVAVFGRGDATAACEWRAVDLARGAAERRAGFRPRRSG